MREMAHATLLLSAEVEGVLHLAHVHHHSVNMIQLYENESHGNNPSSKKMGSGINPRVQNMLL